MIIGKCIRKLFGVTLINPIYNPERGEIILTYQEETTPATLDITAAGRGLHQTLLLLAYLYGNPNSVLLIDEPDAHLKILRQRQIYQIIVEIAMEQNCQIIAASHSEVILNEAAGQSTLIAFIGAPHRIDDRGSQAVKALKLIGYDQYYLAESKGWVLYLEGSTDLAIIREFAKKLQHPVIEHLDRPFVTYVGNQPHKVAEHFYGVAEAKEDLVGVAIFDKIDAVLRSDDRLRMIMWDRREIENYLCYPEALLSYSLGEEAPDLFDFENRQIMEACIQDFIPPIALRDRNASWWSEVKASDQFLDLLFEEYFKRIELPNVMRKSNYHTLASLVPTELIIPEISEKLDSILEIANKSKPII